MTMDRSLKTSGGLDQHRNVLTRAERIEKLVEQERLNMDEDDPLSLPKVANRKLVTAKKTAKKEAEAEAAAAAEAGEGAEGAQATEAAGDDKDKDKDKK